ncbi:hypothetical protein CVCC1112_720 [Paenarthrobacter nicotinovorans]|uniref:hypothetical protein n=1 Tax=Paenarthrobacter nicotinovorans TaxID=29320 RepID=UPI0007CC9408|nr:hypothetical protein [Paenarthrobacter nicotinovorans]GAT86060.1 hypothetical protein CVCC1112_720 [Paenarthrobacter nicotinovorans]
MTGIDSARGLVPITANLSEHEMDSVIRWDASDNLYMLDPDWADDLPHMWLDEETRVSVQDLMREILDDNGFYKIPLPASLTWTAFVKRMECNPRLRPRDLKRWQSQYRFSTALVRLANRRGAPILLFSPTVPHSRAWSPSREFWREAWKRWHKRIPRVSGVVGGQIKFAEWTASFKNGVHRGYHDLVFLLADASASELKMAKRDLPALWIEIIEELLADPKFGAPDSIRINPERCAHIKEFVDENGEPRTDTSYFWKDQQMHRESDSGLDPDGIPRRGSRRGRRNGREGQNKLARSRASRQGSYGVKDLERMAFHGDRAAAELLEEVRADMFRVERMSIGGFAGREPVQAAFAEAVHQRFNVMLKPAENNVVDLAAYRDQKDVSARSQGEIKAPVILPLSEQSGLVQRISGGVRPFETHAQWWDSTPQPRSGSLIAEHHDDPAEWRRPDDLNVEALRGAPKVRPMGQRRDDLTEDLGLEWPMHRTKSARLYGGNARWRGGLRVCRDGGLNAGRMGKSDPAAAAQYQSHGVPGRSKAYEERSEALSGAAVFCEEARDIVRILGRRVVSGQARHIDQVVSRVA